MRDARVPQSTNELRRGIGFDGVKHLARKLLDEETGGTLRSVGAIEDHGFVRREGANYRPSVRIDVQLKGPPEV